MGLNNINSKSTWGQAASDINTNFTTIDSDLKKVKNATTRNKGYFSTSSELISAFPTASKGDIAYVGSSYPYDIWKWNGGSWAKSGSTGGEESVNLGNYYTKVETDEKFTEADAKLSELGSEVVAITGIKKKTVAPILAALQKIVAFNIDNQKKYKISILLDKEEEQDVYFGILDAEGNTIKTLNVLVAGKTSLNQLLSFDTDYKVSYLYYSYYHNPTDGQHISASVETEPMYADFKEFELAKNKLDLNEVNIKSLSSEVFIGNILVNPLGQILPIVDNISLVKGFTYKISYKAIGGAFTSSALRLKYNESDIWIANPTKEQEEYEFTPSEDYKGVTLAFIAYGGADSYGESVYVSLNVINSITKNIQSLKEDVNKALPLTTLLGVDNTYDAYSPIQGGGQILGTLNLMKGASYKLTISLSKAEKDIVFCGMVDANGKTITGSIHINPGTLVKDIDVIPTQDYVGAKIYVSYYHAPQTEQSITAKIVSENIYDVIKENSGSSSDSFAIRTKRQMELASHLGYGRKSTWVGDYMPDGWIPQLVFLHISDTHQNDVCANNAITALNMLSKEGLNKGNNAKFLIHTGDIKTENYLSDFSYWENARSKANKPVYHVVGNHDCGLNNKVSTSGSDEQVYASNTEPFIEEWDLTTTNDGTPHPNGKNYYFKDFSDEKVRLIVLYEYEHDMEVNPVDSSLLKYSRVYRAFRQEQIDWLIESLMTTPSGWGVIIAKHQMEYADDSDNAFSSYFLRGKREQNTYVGEILPDIVQAYIDGKVINKSYQQTGAVVTTLNAVADFSNKNPNAEFICYLSGHTHLDSVHYLRDYPKQLELTIGCDNTNYTHGSDMNQIAGTKTEDVINVCSIDRNRGYVYVVRIGADMSYTCQKRDVLSIKYRNL